ncbi:TatD family hydrolase [Candidatus Poribacteria bacterium]|jgi:TatD DNase family protein|nr:TatD family hydrolase [Candidatus Poribacteria bacterium]MBT5536042.1 TatD family hydrolase [Candidatus Poribacteria bacterium]MBT5709404.1 TatD family hydrolase [Candidatus Poribacteria bacterium]MBT7807980.1 TatD family hydrolase [Candidatus Poribacteria bacterium]
MGLALFDTHAHVQLSAFDADRDDTLARARIANVLGVLNVGIDVESSRAAASLAEHSDQCWATAGLHPHDADAWTGDLRAELRDIAGGPRVVAIGETGLDYYRDLTPRDMQATAFRGQIELSIDLGLPLVIHNRDATDDVLAILGDYVGVARPLLHCFGDSDDVASRAIEMGCVLGIGGTVTYPKSQALRDTVAGLPDGSFVLETDSPWLTPQCRRGKRNEPAYVVAVAEQVAELRGISVAALATTTTDAARNLFSIDAAEA